MKYDPIQSIDVVGHYEIAAKSAGQNMEIPKKKKYD
jgi:hypothetical protein